MSEDEKVVKGAVPKTYASSKLQEEVEKELEDNKAESSETPSIKDLVRRGTHRYSED